MSKDNFKSTEVDNREISELILKFRLCADAASELAGSVERFTGIYSNMEKNVAQLKEIDRNLNDNEYIKSLLEAADSMKDIFQYFNSNIPELSKSMQLSKKELDAYKEEFQFLNGYFRDLPKELDNATGSKAAGIRKKVMEDIKNHLDTRLEDFQKETLKFINDSVEKAIGEKLEAVFNEFNNKEGNFPDLAYQGHNEDDLYTIYSLYANAWRSLPIFVRRNTWSSKFYMKVDKIEAFSNNEHLFLTAYGTRFKGDTYYDSFQVSADVKEFKLYENIDYVEKQPIDDGEIPF